MPPIFKKEDGSPLACFIDPASKSKAVLLKAIRSNGGGMSVRDTQADIILIDADLQESRQRARDMCRTSIVVFNEWVQACVDAGRLLGADHKWGSLRIDDPALVDESFFTDGTPSEQNDQHVTRAPEQEVDVKPVIPASSLSYPTPHHPPEPPVSAGAPSHTKSGSPHVNFGIPRSSPGFAQSPVRSFTPPPDSSAPPSSNISVAPPNSTKALLVPSFGQVPPDPHLAALFMAAHEQWQKLKQGSGLSASITRNSANTAMDRQRESSYDPLDVIATPERIYEPLARRPRPSHDVSGSSPERGTKRRKLGNGPQRGIRSKVPSVLVPAPGAIVYSRSTDDLTKTTVSELGISSTSAPPTPNVSVDKQVFNDLGIPTQFLLQVDLPDRGSIVRLIKRHGGQITSTVQDATYVIVSKTTPQYTEILAVAEEAGRVAVPIAWIHESIKMGRMVAVDEYSISISDSELASLQPAITHTKRLTKDELIAAALSPQPPAPPHSSLNRGTKSMFNAQDRNYLQCLLAWKLYRDSGYSITALCRELHEKVPIHTFLSWREFYFRPATDTERVRKAVHEMAS
ncbi:hypothetical protein FRC07_014541 [Ceratobasidium sp. 392]|nr:hypothetical protein FRC07_014541 [Ceratobasidium sp. 392]